MVADAMSIGHLTFPDLQQMTMPQLQFYLHKRGRMLWHTVETAMDAKRVEGLHDDAKLSGDEPTPVQKALDSYAKAKRGEKEPLTEKDRRYGQAFNITFAKYLGDPDQQASAAPVVPFPGMGRAEARAILNWIADGRYPMEAWADLQPRLEQIEASAF